MIIKYSEDLSESRIASFGKKLSKYSALNAWTLLAFWVVIPGVVLGLYYLLNPGNAVLLFTGIAISIGGSLWFLLCTIHIHLLLRYFYSSCYNGTNNDTKSIELTSNVIKKSKRWVIFYDYGESSPNNIYSNDQIRDILLEKLNGEQQFHISIIFAKPAESIKELNLVNDLLEWQDAHKASPNKVFITSDAANSKLMGSSSADEFKGHYKINDTGYAYLTQHDEGDKRRKYKFYTPYADRPINNIDDCLDFHNCMIEANQNTLS